MLSKIFAKPFPGEKPVILLRRHWFVLAAHLLQTVVFLAVPFLVLAVLRIVGVQLNTGPGDPLFGIIAIGIGIYSGVVILSLFTAWLDYSLDVWLITNERIISVEQYGLFSRTLSEHRLDRIQDVTSEVHGFMQTMLKYGHVQIQTASEQQRFILKQIPNPTEVARRIIELQNEALLRDNTANRGMGVEVKPVPSPQQGAPRGSTKTGI